jgi:hypothetical protein
MDRQHWPSRDNTLIAEMAFTIASTMAYARLLQIFLLHRRIGTLVIAVGNMYDDVLKAAVFFFVVIFGFALGENQGLCYTLE